MQIEKALMIAYKFQKYRIPTIYFFTVIYLLNSLFSLKVAYFLTVSFVLCL